MNTARICVISLFLISAVFIASVAPAQTPADHPPPAENPSLAKTDKVEPIRFYLEQVERRQLAIAGEHEQMKQQALSQKTYLQESRESIRQEALEAAAARIAHYETLYQQALEQASELEEQDELLYREALKIHQRHARQHAELHKLAKDRARKARELLREYESLPASEQARFLKEREPELRSLEMPPQLPPEERTSDSAP